MRARSWMAALVLVVGTTIAVGRAMPALVTSQADDKGKADDAPKAKSNPKAVVPRHPQPASQPLSSICASPGWARKAATFKSSRAMRAASSARFTRSAAKITNSYHPTAMPASSFAILSSAVQTGRSRSPSPSAKKATRPRRSIAAFGSSPNPTQTIARRRRPRRLSPVT